MALRSVKAVGRLGIIQNDMSDPDDEPDILYCDTGTVTLTSLAPETRYLGDTPMASLLGQAVITGIVGPQGYITWNGLPYVKIPDLSSEELNPNIPVGATHEVAFVNCRVGGTGEGSRPVNFTTRKIRLARDTVDPVTGECSLIKQMPVPDLGGVPIVQGPAGAGITSLAVIGDTLVATLEGGAELSTDLPAAMLDSDEFMADRIGTPESAAREALDDAGYITADPDSGKLPDVVEQRLPILCLQSGGTYARPDAPVVLFIGTVNPEAFMEDNDIWVNSDPALTLNEIGTAAANPTTALAQSIRAGVGAAQSILVPARQIGVAGSSTATQTINESTAQSQVPVWVLPAGAFSVASGAVVVPAGWNTARISVIWTHNTATVADTIRVRWRTNANMLNVGDLISAGTTVQGDTNAPVPAVADRLAATTSTTNNSIPVAPGGLLRFSVARLGDNAADTFTDPVHLVAVKIERLS